MLTQQLGLMITGGIGSSKSDRQNIEIFNLKSNKQCQLSFDLPDERYWHTEVFSRSIAQIIDYRRLYYQNGPILCGGGKSASLKTCLTMSNGEWSVSHNLKYSRYFHTSWDTPDGGVLLIGGKNSKNTTELLNDNRGSQEMFNLTHDYE